MRSRIDSKRVGSSRWCSTTSRRMRTAARTVRQRSRRRLTAHRAQSRTASSGSLPLTRRGRSATNPSAATSAQPDASERSTGEPAIAELAGRRGTSERTRSAARGSCDGQRQIFCWHPHMRRSTDHTPKLTDGFAVNKPARTRYLARLCTSWLIASPTMTIGAASPAQPRPSA